MPSSERPTDRERMRARRRKKKRQRILAIYACMFVMLIALIMVAIVVVRKLSPSKERMALSDFFVLSETNEAAVILNGQYINDEAAETPAVNAIIEDGEVYLEIGFLKKNIDNEYVYDNVENTLKYTTDKSVYTATLGATEYFIDKNRDSLNHKIILSQGSTVYIAVDFCQMLSDFQYTMAVEPARVALETAGYEKQQATLKKDTELRRFGGIKSAILAEIKKDEKVTVLETYDNDWVYVLSEDSNVLGCLEKKCLTEAKPVVTQATLPAREYSHTSIGENITMLWHQITSNTTNADIDRILAKSSTIDVMAPIWFYVSNNNGNIKSNASNAYVNTCHQKGVQVWGVVNNIDGGESVDTTQVLSVTSSRDALINNLIAAAITYNLDGIQIDFESLRNPAADGFMEFIKELSLKCKNNNLVLSICNYPPSDFTGVYNLDIQSKYADYDCLMAYDEFNPSTGAAGPGGSLAYATKAVQNSLEYFKPSQLILGMALYTRVWEVTADKCSSTVYSMPGVQSFINNNGAAKTWLPEEGMNYIELNRSDKTIKAWIEDVESLEMKVNMAKNNGLGGVGIWKNGFDSDGFWQMIIRYM